MAMRDDLIESGVRDTLAAEAHPAAADPRALCVFLESLLALEWPRRHVAVTPAPERVPGVLDVTMGEAPDDPAWASFRVVVHDEVARREWIVAAAVLLETARGELERHRSRATTER